ncbi:MAG: type III pantothenate kinase [Vampirovibrionales bacterium]|nr:type III pantothenate kinase [Vampirovibrionales bacterium]
MGPGDPPPASNADVTLAVDIGNTSASFGLFCGQSLLSAWHADHALSSGDDALLQTGERLRAALKQASASGARLKGVVYCSVSPTRQEALLSMILALTQPFCDTSSPLVSLGIVPGVTRVAVDIGAYAPEQLGPDRLVNLCAARALYPNRAALVADFGTAATFDLLDASGRFLGGAIAPGLRTFWDCLPPKTARLQPVSMQSAARAAGLSTRDCLQSGLAYGYRGLTRGIVDALRTEWPAIDFFRVATGGMALAYHELSDSADAPTFDVIDPHLTLRGLAAIAALSAF